MNITFGIDEGPRIYIERINIVGNFRTEDNVIRRQFRLAEGDAFNRLLVESARKRLRALGFFKTVEVEPQPGSAPDRVIIVVKVEEQPTGELSFGAGYSTSEGIIGDISVTERNLMGKGQYVRLGFSGSLDRAQVDFSFTEPYFLDRNLAAGFDVFHKEVDLQSVASFNQRDTGGNLRLGFPLYENTQMGLRYRFEREEIFNVANNASLAVQAIGRNLLRLKHWLHHCLRHAKHTELSDEWRFRVILTRFSWSWRRCELPPVRRRRSRLLSDHQQDHLGRSWTGWLGHRLGRRGCPLDRSLLQGR